MSVITWTDAALRAQHASCGVHPYLWDRSEKPPIRSDVTAEFIRFCVWLEQRGIRPARDATDTRHRNIETTMKYYAEVNKQDLRDGMKRLAAAG